MTEASIPCEEEKEVEIPPAPQVFDIETKLREVIAIIDDTSSNPEDCEMLSAVSPSSVFEHFSREHWEQILNHLCFKIEVLFHKPVKKNGERGLVR